jgi:uronate dehydrogenase
MRILITGACGVIGRIVVKSLFTNHSLCLLDIIAPQEIKDDELRYIASKHQFVKIDVASRSALQNLIRDFKPLAVIHFAAVLGRETPWEQILSSNVAGAINVFETSLDEGVKQVVYASTNNIYGGYEDEAGKSGIPLHLQLTPPLLNESVLPKPDSRYAVTKKMIEDYANYLSSHSDIKTIGLRIGTVREIDNPELQENEKEQIPRFRTTWLYHQDLSQLVHLCLKSNRTGVYNAISRLPGAPGVFIDVSKAITDLGYMPSKGGTHG